MRGVVVTKCQNRIGIERSYSVAQSGVPKTEYASRSRVARFVRDELMLVSLKQRDVPFDRPPEAVVQLICSIPEVEDAERAWRVALSAWRLPLREVPKPWGVVLNRVRGDYGQFQA